MSRSVKKGPFIDQKLLKKVMKQGNAKNKEPIKTWARSCTIIPEFVGCTFMVHDGRTFRRCYVTEDMVGHKLGEFAPTRTFRGHSSAKAEVTPGAAAPA